MKRAVLFFTIFTITAGLYASTTGKISGIVSDATTGDPLIGVNIVVEGTGRGAVTNLDGYFVILNIPPGFHNLKATMIGYSAYQLTDVRVEIDRTTNINLKMSEEVIAGETVVITAERKVIKMDVAASQRSITSENIEALPVSSVSDVLDLQAGVSGFSVRGGGIEETMFMVDGISLRDERTNQPITGIPLSAVQEISVQTGGFSAEYNNVRSGVVNVVTKDGSGGKYTGTISIKQSPPAAKHFGISPYDPDFYFLRPYLDDAVAWTGTLVGEPYDDVNNNGFWDEGEYYVDYNDDGTRTGWDEYDRRQYASFDGWNAISQSTLSNSDPSDDLTPEAAQRLFTWQHRKEGTIVEPDLNIDAGFGGPVPFIGTGLGNLRFFLSYRQEKNLYLYPVSEDGTFSRTTMLKLTSDLSKSMKLTMTSLIGDLSATTSSRSGGTSYMSSIWGLASAVNQAGFTMPWRLYSNEYWAPTKVSHATFSTKLTHLLGSSSYYEIMIKHTAKSYDTAPGEERDLTLKYEIFPGYFVDEAPVGFYGTPVSSIDGELTMGGAVSTSRDESEIKTTTLKFDYTNQANQRNQIKAGFEFIYDDFHLEFGSINYFLPEGNYWTSMHYYPYRFNAYAQDKLEYEGFISSLGVNVDYINPNADWYIVDSFDEAFYSANYSLEFEDTFTKEPIDPKIYVSPRLSISHPITINSKLYFNYGHYRQIPTAERLFRIQRKAVLDENRELEDMTQLSYIGDPNLAQAKTISYELGYDHAIFDTYLLHLSAYYKDISDQEDWTDYFGASGTINYSLLTANSYEDIRGFEADITKMVGEWITGNINYEYRVNTSGYFGIQEYYENPSDQRDYLNSNRPQNKPRPIPRVKAVMDLHTPFKYGPNIMGQYLFGDWHLNLMGNWTEGSWFTYNPNGISGIEYNFQWKNRKALDMKLSKTFDLGKMKLKLFTEVNNVLDIKTFSGLGFYDIHDYNYYMQSLLLPDEKREEIGLPVFPGIDKNDVPGDVRPDDVEFVPLEWISDVEKLTSPSERPIYYDAASGRYLQYDRNDGWEEADPNYLNQVIEDQAYIDMPNLGSFVFLAPRDIFFGINISYDF